MITNVVPAALARAILVARQCQSKSNRRGWNTPFEIGNDTHHHKAQTRVIILEGEDAENNYFMIKNPSNQPLAQRSGVTIEACLAVHNDWWVVKTIWEEEITSFLSNSRWNITWAIEHVYLFWNISPGSFDLDILRSKFSHSYSYLWLVLMPYKERQYIKACIVFRNIS